MRRYALLLQMFPLLLVAQNGVQELERSSDEGQRIFDERLKKHTHTMQERRGETTLYKEICRMDSLLFQAFNEHDTGLLMDHFSTDLEFHHDKNGISDRNGTAKGFAHLFTQHPDIRRELVAGSLEIHPMGADGALQLCSHRFCHEERDEQICGTSSTIMLWRRIEGMWKVTRVISYDH